MVVRDGLAGRRAVLAGGADVREVFRAPELGEGELVGLLEDDTGVRARRGSSWCRRAGARDKGAGLLARSRSWPHRPTCSR